MLNEIQVGKHTLHKWQDMFVERIKEDEEKHDPSHRLDHFKRVTDLVVKFSKKEQADLAILIPASWLHDLVPIKKSDQARCNASKLSADAAVAYLRSVEYPEKYLSKIAHAIETHSYTAERCPVYLEDKILQDADRLDAIGAIGIARCFSCGGAMNRALYDMNDPYAKNREIDDNSNILDHFFQKLLLISKTMQTESGKIEAKARQQFLELFIAQFKNEIS